MAEGAIWPWSRASHKVGRQGYFSSKIYELAKKHNFSVDEEVKDLPKKIIDIILYGEKDWEGVVKNLERRYHETDSDWTRQEIEQYMVIKQCPICKGKRLKPEVLSVTVGGLSIDKVAEFSIEKAQEFFKDFPKDKVSSLIIKEIVDRLQFLNDVGLGYLTDRKSVV